ncbi:MAG: tetratricopeptide repeat protein [Planctomycetota bacterium]
MHKDTSHDLASASLPLAQKTVAITGRLASMTHEAAAEIVVSRGGRTVRLPTWDTDYLVVGADSWQLTDDGEVSESLLRARQLKERGARLSIVSEEEFLEQLQVTGRGASAEARRLYTCEQLSRLLKIPGSRIRSWVRNGILKPVRSEFRIDYFEFRQVHSIKMIAELLDQGVRLERLRASLTQLQRWLPGADWSLGQLGILEREGTMLIRLDDGSLIEPNGQMRLDFEAPADEVSNLVTDGAPASRSGSTSLSAGESFDRALKLESHGHYEEAARVYRKAWLLGGPNAEIAFNLGNVLNTLGRHEEAEQRFLEAIELDPVYAEAWNNLAGVYCGLERFDDAIAAYGHALDVAPGYADAHYNLAVCLLQLGRRDAARAHAEAYFEQDPSSGWADQLRQQLAEEVDLTE